LEGTKSATEKPPVIGRLFLAASGGELVAFLAFLYYRRSLRL
jgi:hypothetical protein